MPLIIPDRIRFPAFEALVAEQVPVMDISRAEHQDIRPLRIGLLNLMPAAVREKTEVQFFRLLGNTPLQISPVLVRFDNFMPNTGRDHLAAFYEPFSLVQDKGLDALIVSGANLEKQTDGTLLNFEAIHFYKEWQAILDWAQENVTSTIYSCLGSHFALHHFYHLERKLAQDKIFGVFSHTLHHTSHPELSWGMNDQIWVPHSRWGDIDTSQIQGQEDLEVLIESSQSGWHAVVGRGGREIYLQGHPEYDREDLVGEYERDKIKGQKPPKNYFPGSDTSARPICNWKADASVFYRNWVNFVYQNTNVDPNKPLMEGLSLA